MTPSFHNTPPGKTMTPRQTPPSAPPLLCREHAIRPADRTEIDRFVREIYAAMEPTLIKQGFVNPQFRINLALHEAVVNAWLHGNEEDRSKTVTVRWQLKEDLILEVMDEGRGFDFQAIADPRADKNIGKPCGRGIAMITYLADQVSWQDQGRHLIAFFGRIATRKKKKPPEYFPTKAAPLCSRRDCSPGSPKDLKIIKRILHK